MKRALTDLNPPAPIVPVEVRAPSGEQGVEVDGLLDTGADMCAVPEHLVEELRLRPWRTILAGNFVGPVEVLVYRIDLYIDGMSFPGVNAVLTRRPRALIGRNVLRHLVLRIDGPRETLELTRPRRRAAG